MKTYEKYFQSQEEKEVLCSNNNKYDSKLCINNNIIQDLLKKGFSNSQIKDFFISIENNNNDNKNNLTSRYTPINNKVTIKIKIGPKLKGYNSFMNETDTDINKKRMHSYYNTKNILSNNINETNNKIGNDNNKSNIKMNISKIENVDTNRNLNLKNDNKNKIANETCDRSHEKFNSRNKLCQKKSLPKDEIKANKIKYKPLNLVCCLKDSKNYIKINNNSDNRNNLKVKVINYRKIYTKIYLEDNIYAKKTKSKINLSSIKRLSKNKDVIKDKVPLNTSIYNPNNSNISKITSTHHLNLHTSFLLFKGKPLIHKNNNSIYKNNNINYKTLNSSIKEGKEFKNLNIYNKKVCSANKLTLYDRTNHLFYYSSYGNLKSNKNKLYSKQKSNKEQENINKFYIINNYNSDKKDKKESVKKKSFKIASKKIIIYKSSDKSKHQKIDKIINYKNKTIHKEYKSVPMSFEQKGRDRNMISKKDRENNNNQIKYETNNNNNLINIYNHKYKNIKKRNNSVIKNNIIDVETKTSSEHNITNIEEKNNLNFRNRIYYSKTTKKYNDGKYEGYIINDKRELKGIMFYENGSKYEGQWKNDKRHGKGIFISQNYNNPNLIGIKYEGEFNNDKIEGYGIGSYTSGDRYEGEWKNNKQYGRGVLLYKEGGKYIGEWKNGKFNGKGIYFLKNGERYEGNFIDDKYNGYGKYYYNDGEYLEGIFKNDLPSGSCLLHKVDGNTEERDFD